MDHGVVQFLSEAAPYRHQGELISRLASNRFAVGLQTDVYNLATAMEKNPDLLAVGVVDSTGAPVGLISRQQLFDSLGKMCGRDLFKRKQVSAMVKPARAFCDDMNIFAVAELLRDDLHRMDDTWYVLVTAAGKYSGVFCTRNLLIYLSDTTARELALARRLQTAIVQEYCEENESCFDLACSSKMAKEVGGDFYIVKKLDNKRRLVGLCDVSGKGIAASLVTAVLGGIFDGYSASSSLPEFLQKLNKYSASGFRVGGIW
jgi:sigma-B regulation protein RsbU (phosphoserine phosphatase)